MPSTRILAQLLRLGASDLLRLARFKWQIVLLRVALRWFPITKIETWCELNAPFVESAQSGRFDRTPMLRCVRLVDIAAHHGVIKGSCLVRSIVLKRALAEFGTLSELRIGIHKNSQTEFAAHAWLEVNGVPINDRADIREHFAAFDKKVSSRREAGLL
jgi:Transglutaminase-like superfamily